MRKDNAITIRMPSAVIERLKTKSKNLTELIEQLIMKEFPGIYGMEYEEDGTD